MGRAQRVALGSRRRIVLSPAPPCGLSAGTKPHSPGRWDHAAGSRLVSCRRVRNEAETARLWSPLASRTPRTRGAKNRKGDGLSTRPQVRIPSTRLHLSQAAARTRPEPGRSALGRDPGVAVNAGILCVALGRPGPSFPRWPCSRTSPSDPCVLSRRGLFPQPVLPPGGPSRSSGKRISASSPFIKKYEDFKKHGYLRNR